MENQAAGVAHRAKGSNLFPAVGVSIQASPVRNVEPREDLIVDAGHVNETGNIAACVGIQQIPGRIILAGEVYVASRDRLVRLPLQIEASWDSGQGAKSAGVVTCLRGHLIGLGKVYRTRDSYLVL